MSWAAIASAAAPVLKAAWGLMKKFWYIPVIMLLFAGVKYYRGQYLNEQDRADRWKGNHDEIAVSYDSTRDELGRLQTRVKTQRVTIDELNSDLYQRDSFIQNLRKELNVSGAEIKRLKSMLKAEINAENEGKTVVRDTIIQVVRDTVRADRNTVETDRDAVSERVAGNMIRIDDDFLKLNAWWVNRDSVNWKYHYQESIYYWTEVQRQMYNEKGNKRFVLWRWIWPNWQERTFIKSTNPESEIKARELEVVE